MDVEAYVVLTKGQLARVDPDDLDLLSKYSWRAQINGSGRYYARAVGGTRAAGRPWGISGRKKTVFMHRLLLNFPDAEVDHINRDTLDNRRCNLRPCTKSQNEANKRKQQRKVGFRGVYLNWSRWRARIRCNGVRYCLGTFSSAEEAAKAYDAKARELFGEFAATNFPPE